MNQVLYSVCIGSVALTLTARAQQFDDRQPDRARLQHRTATVQAARPANRGGIGPYRYNSKAEYRYRVYNAPRHGSNVAFNQNSQVQAFRERNAARNEALQERNFAANQEFRAQRGAAMKSRTRWPASISPPIARERNFAVDRARNVYIDRHRNFAVNRTTRWASAPPATEGANRYRNTNEFRADNNFAMNRDRNFALNQTRNFDYYRQGKVRITNNWNGDAFSGQRYAPFRNYQREWHDRGWWRSHYDRIIFVDNGWYYWDAGYWFPAWGYDPYVTYAYDGPIYAYAGLPPDQVTVDVQQQLAAAGYYDGPIDGVLGPMTRQAIADFQADNGLAITSAIDEPTLATLGLV